MLRILKVLAVLAVAACAMTAVASASAVERFHSEGGPTTLTGSQVGTDVFTTDGGTVECEEAKYTGTQANATATTITVAPTYSNCSALSGFASATIDMNGCEFKFNEPSAKLEGTTDIVCPAGKEITVTASSFGTSKCIIHIPPQTGLGTIEYTNEGTGPTREVIIFGFLIGIDYTETAGTGFGACSANTGTNGTYECVITVTGAHSINGGPWTHTGVWIV
jgi:opacity protein-like surface antigen